MTTKELQTEGMGHARDVQRCRAFAQTNRQGGQYRAAQRLLPRASQSKPNTTHVDFGFAYYRYAIFVLYWFTSHEWDTEVRENGALRWRKEIVCDEFHSLDGGVRSDVVAHR